MLRKSLLFLFLSVPFLSFAQTIHPENITIVRDTFGTPHIYAKTDAEASYGLAWAFCEDDFESVQLAMLSGKGLLGRVQGKKGVLLDFAFHALKIDSTVNARYDADLSADYKKLLEGYAQGVNDYCAAHPREVLLKKMLPVTPRDIVKGYVVSASLMAGLGLALKATRDDHISDYFNVNDGGSNAFAVSPDRMEDGKGYLLSNSHQPNEGPRAWYEAHVVSEEGWDMMGGLFAGGVTLFTGTNRHLGWAHTNNYHNFGDIYLLEINPKNKHQYKLDGKWCTFQERKVKLKVKIAGVVVGIPRKLRWSVHGPVFETKSGVYAFRYPGYMDIRSGEQWYRMNKAKNLAEFKSAMEMNAIPLFNIIYGDVEGNILYHCGGRVPVRDPHLDWSQPIEQPSSAYIWDEIMPAFDLPGLENPACGYVFNANNSPYIATGAECNWKGDFVGVQRFMNNRGDVFNHYFATHDGDFSEADLHEAKFLNHYAPTGSYRSHFDSLYTLDPEEFPKLAESIAKIKRWNGRGDRENKDAALILMAHEFLREKYDSPFAFLLIREQKITQAEAAWAIGKAQKRLKRFHGTLDVPLGEVQQLMRGKESRPADGLREVPRAAQLKYEGKGVYRVKGGDCFIMITRFGPDGPEVRSVNTFGASADEDSPHFTDQLDMFSAHQYKPRTFDRAAIFDHAERVYLPGGE